MTALERDESNRSFSSHASQRGSLSVVWPPLKSGSVLIDDSEADLSQSYVDEDSPLDVPLTSPGGVRDCLITPGIVKSARRSFASPQPLAIPNVKDLFRLNQTSQKEQPTSSPTPTTPQGEPVRKTPITLKKPEALKQSWPPIWQKKNTDSPQMTRISLELSETTIKVQARRSLFEGEAVSPTKQHSVEKVTDTAAVADASAARGRTSYRVRYMGPGSLRIERDASAGDDYAAAADEEENNAMCGEADVWMTPIRAKADGTNKWKIKRVWNSSIPEVNEQEEDFAVDGEELLPTIKELLGLPQGEVGEEAADNVGENGNVRAVWGWKSFVDVDGLLLDDDEEEERQFTEYQVQQELETVVKEADHEGFVEEVDYFYSSRRGFGRPEEWLLTADDGEHLTSPHSESPSRGWKVKRQWTVKEIDEVVDEAIDLSDEGVFSISDEPFDTSVQKEDVPVEAHGEELEGTEHEDIDDSTYSAGPNQERGGSIFDEWGLGGRRGESMIADEKHTGTGCIAMEVSQPEDTDSPGSKGVPTWRKKSQYVASNMDDVKMWWDE